MKPGHDGADPLIIADVEDPEGAKEIIIDGKRVRVREKEKRERRVDVLEQYLIAHKITHEQHKAGRDFQSDCQAAELRSQSSPQMIATGSLCYFGLSDGKLSAMDSASKARARLRRLLSELDKPTEQFVLAVLLERVAPCVVWPKNGALDKLREVLDELSGFYAGQRTA